MTDLADKLRNRAKTRSGHIARTANWIPIIEDELIGRGYRLGPRYKNQVELIGTEYFVKYLHPSRDSGIGGIGFFNKSDRNTPLLMIRSRADLGHFLLTPLPWEDEPAVHVFVPNGVTAENLRMEE